MGEWIGAAVAVTLIVVVLVALLHPDPKRRNEARDLLKMLLLLLPWVALVRPAATGPVAAPADSLPASDKS